MVIYLCTFYLQDYLCSVIQRLLSRAIVSYFAVAATIIAFRYVDAAHDWKVRFCSEDEEGEGRADDRRELPYPKGQGCLN